MNSRRIGSFYEDLAADYLMKQGYTILERNFTVKSGEIDIIAREAGCLSFVEVKYRRRKGQGSPLSAVTYAKQRKISRTAALWMLRNRIPEDTPCRFDVIGIEPGEISLIRNAFDYTG
ncbi:MAG: YraN family protein [Lachnospiraceae bacterium]|nr:YraN family protein [Lachnospiraceae bacterium]